MTPKKLVFGPFVIFPILFKILLFATFLNLPSFPIWDHFDLHFRGLGCPRGPPNWVIFSPLHPSFYLCFYMVLSTFSLFGATSKNTSEHVVIFAVFFGALDPKIAFLGPPEKLGLPRGDPKNHLFSKSRGGTPWGRPLLERTRAPLQPLRPHFHGLTTFWLHFGAIWGSNLPPI